LTKGLKKLAVITTIGMLFVLLGGALVTKTDSGDGCGQSWPLCHGELIPSNIDTALIIELSHRVVSGVVGILVLLLSVLSWKKIGHIRETKFLSILSFSFLVIQGLIGAAAVIWGQSDFVLAIHFGISLISFAAVLLLTFLIFEIDKKFEAEKLIIDNRMKKHIIGLTIFSFIVVYTGALVRHLEASMICPSWPLCTPGNFSLPTNIYEWVQMGHRALAGIIFLWILYVMVLAIRHYQHQPIMYYGWIISFILVSLQVMAGALVIFTQLNIFIALLHALFVSLLFGVFSYFVLLVTRSKKNEAKLNNAIQQQLDQKDTISDHPATVQP